MTSEEEPEEDPAEKSKDNAKSGLIDQVFEVAATIGTGIAKLLD